MRASNAAAPANIRRPANRVKQLQAMIDLNATYQRLTRPWTHEQLAAHYREAEQHGSQPLNPESDDAPDRPIALLATAIPPTASLSVAIHALHILPASAHGELADQLLDTAQQNATRVLHRCHRALQLDGQTHDYTADEWLPVVYDVAAPLLQSVRLDQEPPSIVQHTQAAVRWLASAILNLDQDSAETPTALADALGHLLTLCVFADAARERVSPRGR